MLEALFIAAAALAGSLTQRIVGFGVPSFLVPALLVYFQPPVAIVTFLLVSTLLSLLNIFAHRDKKEIIWPVVNRLFIAAIPGLVVGAFIVTHIDKPLLQIVVGLIIILGICIQELVFPKPEAPLRVSRGISASGFIAGVFNTSVGVSSSPLILWFRTHACRPNQIRHNLAVIFLLMNITSFISIYLTKSESLTSKPLMIFVWLLPVVLTGNFIGQMVAKRINSKQFEKGIFAVIIVAGLLSVILGAAKLI